MEKNLTLNHSPSLFEPREPKLSLRNFKGILKREMTNIVILRSCTVFFTITLTTCVHFTAHVQCVEPPHSTR